LVAYAAPRGRPEPVNIAHSHCEESDDVAISPLRSPVFIQRGCDQEDKDSVPFRLGVTTPNCHPQEAQRADVRIPAKLMNRIYCVYILSNSNKTLCTGVTSDLVGRVIAHRLGVGSRFTNRHGLHSLVWYESTNYVWSALEREKQIKSWKRKRKLALIESMNPGWSDLSPALGLPVAVDL
jgi:putative endonuclease